MSNMKRFADLMNDDLAWFGQFSTPITTTYRKGVWVDTDKFDLIPKKEYRQELISTKEQELKKVEEQAEAIKREIKELKQ